MQTILHRQTITNFWLDGRLVRLVGYWDEFTDPGCWEWFEVFDHDVCLNPTSPIYTTDDQVPSPDQVMDHLGIAA
jgi:hypothetical protein